MRLSKRNVGIVLCLITLFGGFWSDLAIGKDEFPSRPITLLVGYAPGGSADIQARLISELVSKSLGERVIVELKPGNNAAIMLNYLKRQKPDGYTIASAPVGPFIINPHMMKIDYSHRDFTYLISYSRLLHGFSVRSDAPWKSFPEFVDYAKKNPGKVKFATHSPTSTTYFLMNLIGKDNNIDWIHVPYKSDGQAATALLGGHVDAIACASGQVPFITSGQIKLLAIFNKKRFSEYPDVPTLEELGYKFPNLSHMTTLTGFIAPKGLSGEPFEKLVSAFKKAFEDPSFKKMMKDLSCPIDIMQSSDFEKEVYESYNITEKIVPQLLKEVQK